MKDGITRAVNGLDEWPLRLCARTIGSPAESLHATHRKFSTSIRSESAPPVPIVKRMYLSSGETVIPHSTSSRMLPICFVLPLAKS